MHSAQELVCHIEALTSLPTVYIRIREELDSDDCSMGEISQIIAADPALTARLLHVVNSALYGYGGRIDTVHRAVTILGLQQVHDMVLAMSIGSVFQDIRPEHMDMNRFWRGSVMCGLAAREIAQRVQAPNTERMLTIGLLADLGHLVMYQTVPALVEEAREAAQGGDEPLHQAERRIVGCDHAEVGATLAEHWRLPACFAQVIGAQVVPRLAGDFVTEAGIINLATHIVQADNLGLSSDQAVEQVDDVVWTLLDLPPDQFSSLRESAELNLASFITVLFPSMTA